MVRRLLEQLRAVAEARKYVCSIGDDYEEGEDHYNNNDDDDDKTNGKQKKNILSSSSSSQRKGTGVKINDNPIENGDDEDDGFSGYTEDDPPLAFMRNDDYGLCGWYGPRLTVLEWVRVILRVVIIAFALTVFGFSLMISTWIMRSNERANSFWSRWIPTLTGIIMQYLLGFEPLTIQHVVQTNHNHKNDDDTIQIVSTTTTTTKTTTRIKTSAPVLVCNHVSYLDIPILCWALFPSFVAKESVKHVPIWGRLAQVMQCTFVSHGSTNNQKTSSSSATEQLIQRIQQHPTTNSRKYSSSQPPLIVFPEGTTTNGAYLIRFKSGVFAARRKVQPIVIHYHWTKFNPAWETIGLTRHIIYFLAQPTHRATITILSPVDPPTPSQIITILQQQQQQHQKQTFHNSTFSNIRKNNYNTTMNESNLNNKQQQIIVAKYFADHTRHIMSKVGKIPCSNHTYKDKQKYHDQLRAAGYS